MKELSLYNKHKCREIADLVDVGEPLLALSLSCDLLGSSANELKEKFEAELSKDNAPLYIEDCNKDLRDELDVLASEELSLELYELWVASL